MQITQEICPEGKIDGVQTMNIRIKESAGRLMHQVLLAGRIKQHICVLDYISAVLSKG